MEFFNNQSVCKKLIMVVSLVAVLMVALLKKKFSKARDEVC
jgi:cell shape-determining protein MreC